jgi:methyl-accepting chemotaxis protein
MTVGKKLSLTIALLVAFSIGIGVIALVVTSRMYRYQEAVVNDPLPAIYHSAQIRSTSKELRTKMLMHIGSRSKTEMAAYDAEIGQLRDQIKTILHDSEKTMVRADQRAAFARIEPAFDRFLAAWEPIRAISRGGNRDRAFGMYQKSVEAVSDDLMAAITVFFEANKKYSDELTLQSSRAAASARWWIGSMLAAAVLFGAVFGFYFVRSTNTTLHFAVAELRASSAQTATASSQVAVSSQALAQGASEQAAGLEETSASAEEITSMTRKNAENSQTAAELMSTVDQHVKEGNRTLEQMVVSMHEINASSDKISKIIKVIDEIAFQTNILALNAAVEAARAGEAGMGFAVVADEVRNLAQRSAQAAKDTARLIEESIAKSNDGSTRLQEVTEVIRSITESAAKVKTLVDEVNLGSQEQARGVDEISKAITQMSQVTQGAAAHSQESAAASQQLSAQATAMDAIVVRLRKLIESDVESGEASRIVKTKAPVIAAKPVAKEKAAPGPAVSKARPKPAGSRQSAIPLEDDFTEM